jgi:hypothetical protein
VSQESSYKWLDVSGMSKSDAIFAHEAICPYCCALLTREGRLVKIRRLTPQERVLANRRNRRCQSMS